MISNCPHCFTPLETSEELLAQADGMVRCGNCLQVFNGFSGELEVILPQVSDVPPTDPLAGIAVEAMSTADIPQQRQPMTALNLLLILLLSAGLVAQLAWVRLHPAPDDSITLEKLIIRPQPGLVPGLRVDAILQNHSNIDQGFPRLHLGFTNQYGEQQAWRSFDASEYLHGDWASNDTIPPRSSIQVSLTLRDPGNKAVTYNARLQFLPTPKN